MLKLIRNRLNKSAAQKEHCRNYSCWGNGVLPPAKLMAGANLSV